MSSICSTSMVVPTPNAEMNPGRPPSKSFLRRKPLITPARNVASEQAVRVAIPPPHSTQSHL